MKLKMISLVFMLLTGCQNLDRLVGDQRAMAKYEGPQAPYRGTFAEVMRHDTGVTHINDGNLSENVQKVALWVRWSCLEQDKEGRAKIKARISDGFPGWFGVMMEFPDNRNYTAWCQVNALSLSVALRTYGLQVREVHYTANEPGAVSTHEFNEYYNTQTGAWEVIDAYYGIQYRDGEGRYLSVAVLRTLGAAVWNTLAVYDSKALMVYSPPEHLDRQSFIDMWSGIFQ